MLHGYRRDVLFPITVLCNIGLVLSARALETNYLQKKDLQ